MNPLTLDPANLPFKYISRSFGRRKPPGTPLDLYPMLYPGYGRFADKNIETMTLFARAREETGETRGEQRISGVGYVTHEPPLRMAERSPAAKQSIYAFKMAAKNATHPTPRLPLPRTTYTAFNPLPLPAAATEPFLSATGLSPPSSSLHPSHVCPRSSLTSEPSHRLPTSQYYPCRPRGCSFSRSPFLSLAYSFFNSSPFRLSPSFLYPSPDAFLLFSSDICFIRLQLERARPLKMTPSQIDKARKIYCCARQVLRLLRKCRARIAIKSKGGDQAVIQFWMHEGANFDSLPIRPILKLEMTW